jgi:hypothetical protein
MLLREVEIDGGLFEVTMPEQNLDGAQVGSCFQQVRRKAMPQCVGMNVLILQPGVDRPNLRSMAPVLDPTNFPAGGDDAGNLPIIPFFVNFSNQ